MQSTGHNPDPAAASKAMPSHQCGVLQEPAARLSVDELLSAHETRYGTSAGRIMSAGKSGIHAVEIRSTYHAFEAPGCDFHRFNYQLSGRMALIDFQLKRQTKRKPGHVVTGNFAFVPCGSGVRAHVDGDPFHMLQIMIPRGLMQGALERVTGTSCDDEDLLGHVGAGSANTLRIGQLLEQEYTDPTSGDEAMVECLVNALALELARRFRADPDPQAATNGLTAAQAQLVVDMMQDALAGDIRIGDIAQALGIPAYQLTRRFKAQFGETPQEHLLRLRLERVREMLVQSDAPLVEIAFDCGFSSQAHMTTAFSRHYGVSPARQRSQPCARS